MVFTSDFLFEVLLIKCSKHHREKQAMNHPHKVECSCTFWCRRLQKASDDSW